MRKADGTIAPGHNLNHHRKTAGRPHALSDPERVKLVAAMFVQGATRPEMAAEFRVSEWSITQWRKDPRVRAAVTKLVEDRVQRICSRVDHIIEGRLMKAEDMDTELLLRIRKEFLGGAFRVLAEGGKADDQTVNEALGEVEADPELVEGLRLLLARKAEATALAQQEE